MTPTVSAHRVGRPTQSRLGQFFTEWGLPLTSSCVGEFCAPESSIAIFVNGEEYDGDPGAIELADNTEIAIVIGEAPASVPSVFSGE